MTAVWQSLFITSIQLVIFISLPYETISKELANVMKWKCNKKIHSYK